MGRHFFIFLFLCFLLHLQQTKASTVPIGAITNPTTRIGREQKVAIQLAVEKFSDLSLLANVSDLNSTDPSPMSSYVQNLVQLGAKSIIAAGTVPQVFIAGTFGEGAKVPIVSMAASPFLSGNFLIQMSYPETAFVRCIADIVKSFNWRKVIAVYEDDVFGSISSSALLLSNALDAIGSELEYSLTFQPSQMMSDSRTTVREQLNNTKSQLSTVYIILRISETLAPIIFEEAVSLGLMTKGYIWICGNDITTLLDSSFTPTFISKYMQGLVGIRSYINVTAPDYVNFQSTFQQRFKTEYEKSGESSFDPGVYALRAYDAVDAISLAAATPEKNNKSLVENLVATNFSGLSGLVRPTNGSLDEGARYSTFHILNVFGRSYREMGIWVDGNGFYENEEEFDPHQPSSEKLQSVVFWPGGPHTSPSGLRTLKVGVPARIRSYHTKIVIILWFFVAQLVLNSFTASLSSILVTQNLRPDADTMKIGCDGDSFVPNYLTSVLNYSAESIVNINNGSEYKLAFENGTITAAYLEVPYLRVFLSQNDNYTVYGETQMLGGFGFVLPKGSPLASDMSEAILKLGENGTLRQLEKKWFPVSLSNYVAPDEDSNQSLGLSNYTYMFVISSCLAFLTILHRFYEAIRAILDQPTPLPPAPPVPPNNVDPYDGMADIPLHDDPGNRGRVAEIELPDINRGRVANIEQPNVPRDRGDEIEDFPLHNRVVHEMEDGRVAEIAQPHVNRGRVAHIEQPHVPRGRVDEIEDFPLQNRVVHEMEDGRVAEIAIPQVNIGRVADIEQLHVPRGRVDEVEDWHLQNRVVHEMEDIDLHDGVHNIGYRPSELQNDDTRPNMSGPKKRIQHAATFSDVSMATRVLLSFLSFRPRHIQEIERQGLLDSAQHELENSPNLGLHNNDSQPGSSSIGKRFQHAASSSSLLRITHTPQRSQSLHTRKDLQDATYDAEDQYLLVGSHEGGEPASVVQKSDAESSLARNLRRRPSFNSN
ncbi:hypothetical protein LUZ61_005884 [Rhynchospora tenuis]|uniref:Ionotropic glutamate receptor C-terminal domain-containing protein n=1 Tax=Rhynchospora tenuis TaxID=198213 RepID=A0AAD5ZQR6_9POAL|nr:hypothetical protein LUZ61_005884 [Rhynchospora tenuis]